MSSAFLRRGLSVAAIAAAIVLAGCGPTAAELEEQRLAAEAAALAARQPPPISLNDSVAQSASVYLGFIRDVATVRGGFADADAIQAALRKGSGYDPAQLSRGMIAYASILALQSPEFVAGVRQYGGDPATRAKLIADIVADPRYAANLPGADAAAGLIMGTLGADINALSAAAQSVEDDAYTIQERNDPRRGWAMTHILDREGRLQSAKSLSAQAMLPSAEESARLFTAAHSGAGLVVSSDRRNAPYTPAVNNALAIAALAALGAAGNDARANTDALQEDKTSQFCLSMSKLNLYQCLAASRPSYEDMFCVGRHVVRDLASCTRGAAMPAPRVTVSDPVATGPALPAITPAPFEPPVSTGPAAPAITTAPLTTTGVARSNPTSTTATLNTSN
jgi:hypothetical protein